LIVAFTVAVVLGDSNDVYHKDFVLASGKTVSKFVTGNNGSPKFAAGDFGKVEANHYHSFVKTQLGDILGLQGTENFEVVREEKDFKNNKHIVLQQTNRGLVVEGGEVILHISETSDVFAFTSSVLPDTIDQNAQLQMEPLIAIKAAMEMSPLSGDPSMKNHRIESAATLCYLIFNDKGFLAYKALVSFTEADDITPKKEWIFVDANTGDFLVENPIFMNARNRAVYSANNKQILPGTLARKEGQSVVNDQSVNQAYDNSGTCYGFYKDSFNRDSIDNKGGKLISTVHYAVSYNNAFWDGTQMVYGDGDGVVFSDFAGDLSVVCHELTHAVVSYSANLRYQGESGALNEAMADIMGASSTVYKAGGIGANTWHIGHDCYLQGVALRYMDNPILDDASYDWYPTRYKGSADNGGVHWNSGIANLAYVLMVQGGVHPQQKSTNWVEEIGISQAQQIFYSALTQYMTQTTTFAGARAATETAAKVLFGVTAEQSVEGAWTAVGV